ncbi:MAG: AlkA N-terminal domain-containing protein [Myxococcota bacterium]|nr:AlkA N-terminal domain-containing protein [Myxococcota bacterium]
MLDPQTCYRALATRDARFDGRFFTGVESTGVFCRPVCPARTPRAENCRFFPSAAAAVGAGFRPCLRCRPESAPGTPAWAGTHALVARALRLIDEGVLDRESVGQLAARLGVGDRHLRRLFLRHLGATPTAVATSRRVLFAKKLLDDTDLTMTQVAGAAGFGSLRRFNDAVLAAYGRPPSALRRRRPATSRSSDERGVRLRLSYRPPFDWSAVLAWLGARAIPGVESTEGFVYVRSIRLGESRGRVMARPAARGTALEVTIRLDRMDRTTPLAQAADRLRRIFDLGADPEAISRQLGRDDRLKRSLSHSPGVRIPGAWDPFEVAVRAILGQQVSVAGATTLAGRLVAAHGDPLEPDPDWPAVTHLFPTPERLAEVDLEGLGMPGARARAVVGLARAVAQGELRLDGGRDLDETVASLCDLPGIGPWTAQYIAMRAFGEPDAFPVGDLVLRKVLGEENGPVSPRHLEQAAEAWRPWRGYAAMLLWADATRAAQVERAPEAAS